MEMVRKYPAPCLSVGRVGPPTPCPENLEHVETKWEGRFFNDPRIIHNGQNIVAVPWQEKIAAKVCDWVRAR